MRSRQAKGCFWLVLFMLTLLFPPGAPPVWAAYMCPFRWEPVTTDTGGQPLESGRLQGYRLYSKATVGATYPVTPTAQVSVAELGANSNAPRLSVACESGHYWVARAYDTQMESGNSNEVIVPTAPGVPQTFRIEGLITLIPMP